MTKQEIVTELNHAYRVMQTHGNAMVRADGCQAIDAALQGVQALPAPPEAAELAAAFDAVRQYILGNYTDAQQALKGRNGGALARRKLSAAKVADAALMSIGKALGLTELEPVEPEAKQGGLFEVRRPEGARA